MFSPDARLAAALADSYLIFKDALREERERNGLTVDDVADRLGVDPDIVHFIESHESDPTFGELHDYLVASELKVAHTVRSWHSTPRGTVIRAIVPVHRQPHREAVGVDVGLTVQPATASSW